MLKSADYHACFVCDRVFWENNRPFDRIRRNSRGVTRVVTMCARCIDDFNRSGRSFPIVSDRIHAREPWFDPKPELIAAAAERRDRRETRWRKLGPFTEAEARTRYRIVSEPSWQVQTNHRGEWRTVWYCGSEESAKATVERCVERFTRGPAKLEDVLR